MHKNHLKMFLVSDWSSNTLYQCDAIITDLKILVITFVFDAKIFCIHHLMNEPINWILWWKWHFNIFESFLCSFLRADIYFLKNCFHWSNYFFIILVLHDENNRLKSVKYCFIDSHWNCISQGHMWYQVCPL